MNIKKIIHQYNLFCLKGYQFNTMYSAIHILYLKLYDMYLTYNLVH